MKKIKALFKYTTKYKSRYFIGVLFLLLVDLLQVVPPKVIGKITDSIAKGTATPKMILEYIALITLIAVLMATCRFIFRIYIFGTARRVEYDMRNKFFSHLQKLSTNFYNEHKTGDLMALATNDLNAVRMSLGPGVVMMTDSIVLTLITVCIMLTINVKLTILALLPLPLLTLVSSKFGKQIHKKFMKVQEAFSKLTDMVQENFSGIRIIKSFVQEEKEHEKFTKENLCNFDANMSFVRIWGLFSPLIEFISSLSFVLLVGVGGVFVIYGSISLGEFVAFNMYLGMLVWPMMAMGWVINIIQRGFASLERMEEVLKIEPEIYDKEVDEVSSLQGDLRINDLTFYYKGVETPALSHVNLHLKAGETLGLIGRTGSSKSTLLHLLVKLYNVEDGKIEIAGRDINRIPIKTLREKIGFVSQDAFLFSTTIAENVNLAGDTFDMNKIEMATKNADIYENIIDFQEGFQTVVGERGVTLSGGQKQRISISRALLKEPDILIFDDCLSAVDAKTEVKILENLKRMMENRTSIIVSHRISAVKDAELIAVFDEGEIVERGTHRELLEQKGLYYDIYQKQLIEEKIQEEGEV